MSGSASTTAPSPAAPPQGNVFDDWVASFAGVHPASYATGDTAPGDTAPGGTAPGGGGKAANAAKKLKSFAADHVDVEIKEVGEGQSKKYAIKTTIHFDVGKDADASKEGPKPGELESREKSEMKDGASGYAKASETYSHTMTEEQAHSYVDCIKNNGHGGKLLEHQVLSTGLAKGWEAAQQVAHGVAGSSDRDMKAGDERMTHGEAGANVKTSKEKQVGIVNVGVSARGSAKHSVTITEKGQEDGSIKFTAIVNDDADGSASASAAVGKGGVKLGVHGTEIKESGKGETLEFVVQKDHTDFEALTHAVRSVKLMGDLEALDQKYHGLLDSKTQSQHSGKGSDFGIAGSAEGELGGKARKLDADFTLIDKGTLDTSTTTNRAGDITGSTADSAARSGGNISINGVRVGHDETDTYSGKVDKDGNVEGELGHSAHSTDIGKSLHNAYDAVKKDGMKGLKDKDKLIADTESESGLAFEDKQFMSICEKAVEEHKWQGMVGGYMQDEWIKVGQKIRAAMVIKGGKIVSVDKHKANAAVAEWDNSDKGGDRRSVMDTILRPYGGEAEGKASSFPGETKKLKKTWDEVVIGDPVAAARKAMDAGKLDEAAHDLKASHEKLTQLEADMKKSEKSWQGAEVEFSEMLGHIGKRQNEIAAAEAKLKKLAPPAAAAPNAAEADARLKPFNRNKEDMARDLKIAFEKLNHVDAIVKKSRFDNLDQNLKDIKLVEDLIENWQRKYDETYKMFQELSPTVPLNEAELKALHPHGARERCKEVKTYLASTN